ncbi:MAG: Lrp/AsnC family transcriptional regulator, partial [Candidatus Thorarchaeota archaeon]
LTVTAFILLTVEMASQREILNTIRALDEVSEAHLIFGAFDIIVKAEFGNNEELSVFVVDKIKSIPGVGDTQTNIAAV